MIKAHQGRTEWPGPFFYIKRAGLGGPQRGHLCAAASSYHTLRWSGCSRGGLQALFMLILCNQRAAGALRSSDLLTRSSPLMPVSARMLI